MERDDKDTFSVNLDTDFNSHAHVERDVTAEIKLDGDNAISTHTLTWSVTDSREQKWGHIEISTHTLTWSVTIAEGEFKGFFDISTHTLTWSVTIRMRSGFSDGSFQLTRSRGA